MKPSQSDLPAAEPVTPLRRLRRWRQRGAALATVVALYVLLAYLVLPAMWRHYEHNPALADAPKVTVTADGIPGDPLNIGLVGTEAEVMQIFQAAGWYPAARITIGSSLHIAESSVLNRPYPTAPVSNLFLLGRHQDLAFERPSTRGPEQRHHVRLWHTTLGQDRPYWCGAATYDHSIGISHRTGKITHHIAPDVDAERNQLISDLRETGRLTEVYQVTGVGATWKGRNGGGDWYYTDGEVTVAVIAPAAEKQDGPPTHAENPPAVRAKNHFWSWVRGHLP